MGDGEMRVFLNLVSLERRCGTFLGGVLHFAFW